MPKKAPPAGAPAWMVTFADLMSLLVCFFVLIISFSVPDTDKMKIVAGSMRDAFGFTRQIIVTGMVEVDGNPRFKFARDLVPIPLDEVVGPIDEDGRDVTRFALGQPVDGFDEEDQSIVEVTELAVDEEIWQRFIRGEDVDLTDEESAAAPTEEERFEQAERELRQAMQSVPELERLAENLQIDRVPEGLRIQIVDQARTSMFPLGSAQMYPPTKVLLQQVVTAIGRLSNKISIAGHTDSVGFRRRDGYDNWSLSLDRADATRRVLLGAGLASARIASVIGKADTEHMFPDGPKDPRNRRISMTLLREERPPTTPGN